MNQADFDIAGELSYRSTVVTVANGTTVQLAPGDANRVGLIVAILPDNGDGSDTHYGLVGPKVNGTVVGWMYYGRFYRNGRIDAGEVGPLIIEPQFARSVSGTANFYVTEILLNRKPLRE